MTINNEKLEQIIGEVKNQLDLEKKTADIIAEKADALVKSNLEQIEVLHKSISSLTEKVDQLSSQLNALTIPSITDIEKSISAKLEDNNKAIDAKVEEIQKAVDTIADEPIRKSVVAIEEPVQVVVAEKTETIGDLFNQLTEEMKKSVGNHNRMAELRKAVIQLESGVHPQQIKNILKK
jgi:hypothetical protein